MRFLAIMLALIGAAAMAFGAQFQNDAVGQGQSSKGRTKGSLTVKELAGLVRKPRWLLGTAAIGIALIFQLAALSLAPLIVVQPLGAIALVITSLLNARVSKTKLNRATVVAISLCVGGVGGFVAMASTIAAEIRLTDDLLWQVLFILVVILGLFGFLLIWKGKHLKAIYFVLGAGVLYGFVATLTKVIIQRIYQQQFEWVTVLCAVAMVVAVVLGGWFVQNAYASGPPDLVIAGLTVVDPLVAVLIAIAILGEANSANPLIIIGFLVCASIAILGVLLLSQFHPQILLAKRKAAMWSRRRRF